MIKLITAALAGAATASICIWLFFLSMWPTQDGYTITAQCYELQGPIRMCFIYEDDLNIVAERTPAPRFPEKPSKKSGQAS